MNKLKDTYSKQFITSISDKYFTYINSIKVRGFNKGYFNNAGLYYERYAKSNIKREDIMYFDNLLFPPNIYILQYIISNLDKFENLQFVDNGCGFGVLSIFLEHIGISCHNYDNFDQLGKFSPKLDEQIKDIVSIKKVTKVIPLDADVITSSGIWCDNKEYLKLKDIKYIFIDYNHVNTGVIPDLIKKHKLKMIKQFKGGLYIYGK